MRSRKQKAGVPPAYSLESTMSRPAVEQRSVTMSSTAPNWEAGKKKVPNNVNDVISGGVPDNAEWAEMRQEIYIYI